MHLESKVSQTEFSTGERGIIPAVGIRSFPATPGLQFMYPNSYFWNHFEQTFDAFNVVPMAMGEKCRCESESALAADPRPISAAEWVDDRCLSCGFADYQVIEIIPSAQLCLQYKHFSAIKDGVGNWIGRHLHKCHVPHDF